MKAFYRLIAVAVMTTCVLALPMSAQKPAAEHPSSSVQEKAKAPVVKTEQPAPIPTLSQIEKDQISEQNHQFNEAELSSQLAATKNQVAEDQKEKIQNSYGVFIKELSLRHNIPSTWVFDPKTMTFVGPSAPAPSAAGK